MKNIPYATQWLNRQDIGAVKKILSSGYLTQGPAVEGFEKAVAGYCGAKYAVAVNSGTSALHIACLASGLKKGDEGITSAITFAASSNAILYCSANPVFADIEDTICISPQDIRKKICSKTKVIIPVHFGGHPCEMDEIYKAAQRMKITVIEDACHALGAEFRGSKIGSSKYSDMTVFSFHAVKHITTGEGGMVLTNNKALYQKLILLRSHGITRDSGRLLSNHGPWYYEMQELGFNYRLTDFQSALGLSQLKKLTNFIKRRREIAIEYDKAFSPIEEIRLLKKMPHVGSSRHLYIIRLESTKLLASRRELFNEYRKRGIMVNVHYMPVYYHPFYKKLGYKKRLCPNAEKYYEEAITLPLYPKMSDGEVRKVIRVTQEIINRFAKRRG